MATPNTIRLKGAPRYDEGTAGGTIFPGELIVKNSSGLVVRHATSGGQGPVMVAVEDGFLGKTVDDAYASGDLVRYDIAKSGDVMLMRLAAGSNVAKAAVLMSDGAGGLIAHTGTNYVVGRADEAIDNTIPATTAFIRVQIVG